MKKSTSLMTMAGLFLVLTLIWAVPGFAQAQGGGYCGRGYGQGGGPGYCGGGPGYSANNNNSQTCPGYGNGYGRQGRNWNRRNRWNNSQTQPNPNSQNQPNPNSQNQPNPNSQNQTQTPNPAPQSGN
jgi:hypothetical protein